MIIDLTQEQTIELILTDQVYVEFEGGVHRIRLFKKGGKPNV